MWFNKKLSTALNVLKKYAIGHYRNSIIQHDAIMREIKDLKEALDKKTCDRNLCCSNVKPKKDTRAKTKKKTKTKVNKKSKVTKSSRERKEKIVKSKKTHRSA